MEVPRGIAQADAHSTTRPTACFQIFIKASGIHTWMPEGALPSPGYKPNSSLEVALLELTKVLGDDDRLDTPWRRRMAGDLASGSRLRAPGFGLGFRL